MVRAEEAARLDRLESQVENGGGGAWEYLCLARKLQARRSDKVLKHGLTILNDPKARSKLGGEGWLNSLIWLFFRSSFSYYAEWTLYEQVAFAAMDCQQHDVAKVLARFAILMGIAHTSLVHTGPPVDWYTDPPLLGDITDWGCFCLVAAPKSIGNDRFRLSSPAVGRNQSREKKRENLKIGHRSPSTILIHRSRGEEASARLRWENKIRRSRGEGTRRRLHLDSLKRIPRKHKGCDKAPYRAVSIGPPIDRYVDRQLSGDSWQIMMLGENWLKSTCLYR
ncbi:hypothetical protein BHM03_00011693 [Ensete ventricosum]|nr:hypothetical protein BHM03_00011693 [Ensete ventricosum]